MLTQVIAALALAGVLNVVEKTATRAEMAVIIAAVLIVLLGVLLGIVPPRSVFPYGIRKPTHERGEYEPVFHAI